MLLQGLFVPLTCPFYRDGASYLRKLEHNVARYSLSPAAGFLALPPWDESAALTDSEARAALTSVGETAAESKVLLAGIERSSVRACLELAEAAALAGFDALLLAPPPNWARLVHGPDARELVVFYQTLADASPLPIVLWSDPRPPFLELPLELVTSLAAHSKILGLLDAGLDGARLSHIRTATQAVSRDVTVTSIFEAVTGRMLTRVTTPAVAAPGFVSLSSLQASAKATGEADVEQGTDSLAPTPLPPSSALKTRTKRIGFQILSAGAVGSLPALLEKGMTGAVPALASCAPQGCFEVYAAWKDGNPVLAQERASRLQAADSLVVSLGPAAVKFGCDLNGYFGGQPRLPRLPLTATQREEIERALDLTRN